MKSIKELDLKNKKVLLRVDFNVPIINSVIKDDFRLKASIPTIEYCLSHNSSIILMSHLGRPEGFDSQLSLKPIVSYLKNIFNIKIHYSEDCISKDSLEISKRMLINEIHLLDNLRFYKEECMNDMQFAKTLSKHADIYICDAFGLSHRSHASNSNILKYFKMKGIGLLINKEFKFLSNRTFNKHSVVIVGGSKISTKIKMIYNFIGKTPFILIGGAMAFTFLKSKNYNIGKSLCENTMIDESMKIINASNKHGTTIILPNDVVCYSSNTKQLRICSINEINDNDIGLDIGPESCMKFSNIIKRSNNIIWNGPMGKFEDYNYATGTESICNDIINTTLQNDAISIIGGGDTVNAIQKFSNLSDFTHVSTGGGASLKLLSGEKLNICKSWEKYE